MTEMDELKPCPFCGYAPTGEEELLDILDVDEFGEKVEKIKYVGVSCAGCCAYVPVQTHDKTEAIAAWNRRPSLSPTGVTDTEARAFAVAYAKACNHRYDMGAIRAGLEAAAKVRSPVVSTIAESATVGGWRTDEVPMDGTPIYRRVLSIYRFQPYSPKSMQFRSGDKGRWQEMNEYGGWVNCSTPLGNEWKPAADAKGDA